MAQEDTIAEPAADDTEPDTVEVVQGPEAAVVADKSLTEEITDEFITNTPRQAAIEIGNGDATQPEDSEDDAEPTDQATTQIASVDDKDTGADRAEPSPVCRHR